MEKPLVNEGDALYHIASADEKELRMADIIQTVAEMDSDSSQSASGETFQSELSGEPV
jgi:hypothetical protein